MIVALFKSTHGQELDRTHIIRQPTKANQPRLFHLSIFLLNNGVSIPFQFKD